MSWMKCCTRSFRLIVPLVSALALTACGGGGGSAAATADPPAEDPPDSPGPTRPPAPETNLTSTPPQLTRDNDANFEFSSPAEGASFELRIDDDDFAVVTSPHSVNNLDDGEHTVAVRAIVDGTPDPTPASYTWTVDTTAPNTRLLNTPPSRTTQTSANVEFESDEDGVTFEASVDGSAFQSATSPLSIGSVSLGDHTVRLRATDRAGNVEEAVVEHRWTVVAPTGDTTPPNTELTSSAPQSPTVRRTASFSFSASESGSVFEGSLNDEAFHLITSPFQLTDAPDGENTFRIRAIDASGNVDPTPVSVSWTVDATPPETTAEGGPSGAVAANNATITFSANEQGARFEGRLDNQSYRTVTSPVQLTNLAQGSHKYEVRAIDALGNTDNSPLTFNWTVDTQGPNTTLSDRPSDITKENSATFAFTSNDSAATFELKLDDGDYVTVSSPASLNELADGAHTVLIRARDAAGNVDATPASHSWRVDNSAPEVAITFPTPVGLTDATQIAVTGTASDAGGVAAVRVNGIAATTSNDFARWTATVSLNAGTNELTVTAEDEAGNNDTAQVSLKVSPNLFANPDRIALDRANNRALVVDDTRIIALDMNSGARAIFADASNGSGPVLLRPRGIAVDSSNGRLIVADGQLRALVAVNLSSRARTILSDANTGSGPTLGSPQGLALDASGTTAYIVDSSSAIRGIVAVNLQTGARTVLTGTEVGEGPTFQLPMDVALDSASNRLLVTDLLIPDRIMAVDVASGSRSVFSDTSTGSGSMIETAWRIAVDSAAGRALVVDAGRNAVVAISLSNAARSVVSDNGGSGPKLVEPRGIFVDSQADRTLLAEAGARTVVAINNGTGARTRISDDGIGAGPTFGFVEDLAFDPQNGRIIALQNDPYGLVSVNLTNGNRAAALDNSSGGGPQIARAYQIAVDSDANRVIALAENEADALPRGIGLFAVNLDSGDRAVLFNDFRRLGEHYSSPNTSDLALENGRALVAVPLNIPDPSDPQIITNALDVVVTVPLASGNASELSGQGKGVDLSEGASGGLTIDAANNRLLVIDTTARRLVAVNLSNGNRSTVPTGNSFQSPDGVAYDVLNKRPVVSDSGADTVFAIGSNGQAQPLASNDRGRGPRFAAFKGISVDPQTAMVLFYDIGLGAIVAVEPASGDRVIVSR